MPILGPCPLDTHVAPIKTIWGPHIHVGWEETVPEHQSPLRQPAQQLFPPGCESPELNSHRRSLKPHTNPLPPETWTTPPSLPHHKKNCQTFLFNSKCAKQVSVPVQTTCSNTLSSICTRHYCVYIIPQE